MSVYIKLKIAACFFLNSSTVAHKTDGDSTRDTAIAGHGGVLNLTVPD